MTLKKSWPVAHADFDPLCDEPPNDAAFGRNATEIQNAMRAAAPLGEAALMFKPRGAKPDSAQVGRIVIVARMTRNRYNKSPFPLA